MKLPSVYIIEVTNRCNAKCVMCPNGRQLEFGDIDISLIQAIMPQISLSAKYIQLYFMGEPTLHPSLLEIVKTIRSKSKAIIELSTNLSVYESFGQWYELLLSGIDKLLCCVDGVNINEYSELRKGIDYSKVLSNIKLLSSIKNKYNINVEVIIKSISSIYNKSNYADIKTFWERYPGVIYRQTWMNTWAGSMPELYGIAGELSPNYLKDRIPCAELWNKLLIRWNGDVVICCHDWSSQYIIGNVKNNSIYDIWNSCGYNDMRSMHMRGIYMGICSKCIEWSTIQEYCVDYSLSINDINSF